MNIPADRAGRDHHHHHAAARDETTWGNLDVMFATTSGTVRRNKLSDFVDVRRSGIIAMKLDEGEAIVDVQICTEKDDVLLTASGGQCIRFPCRRCACSPAAPRAACAASRSPRRQVISLSILGMPTPRRRSARPICGAPTRCGAARPKSRRRLPPTPRRRPHDRARREALCRDVGAEQFVLTIPSAASQAHVVV